ncbi:helix-turn-helix transcriptional regulator [Streptomyces clavuligerus]|uniref:Putative AraC family transcriptional regulator n=1 Tax=Streptomyces clavuligerus TaxID=1901 RepID=B5GU05_STRCL|nr:AraC family transcriptional regulator [Streptomyces clavuligerus]ANW22104.1 transcriptional regulator [Streptomyces clavuligerus]AXU16743.1 AraC family transcriptional regulator [Streptomyces clavuligerus]EDY49801.1 HTH-type transcriptional repressor [Streptomyces clavuligerus]EFG05478.1 Putative AraC family transcriptional regulator [Streptomyces clavuligerus]MBY6306144.1 helix-turn-helix transcriptional regulator [Streptomyces clavuligerus]
MRTGTARVRTASEQHRLTAGQGLWVPAGLPYEIDVEAGSVAVPIFPAARSRPTAIDRPLRVDFPDSWSDWLIHQFARSLGHLRGAADDSGLLDLVADARPADPADGHRGPLPTPPLPVSPEALTVARTLLQNPSHSAGVDELARSVSVGVRTFQQQFLRETGLPFTRWRTAARVAAAASYLGLGHDIGWTGRQVGFATPAGFTKAFRAYTGVTPSTYKEQRRDGPTGTRPRPSPLEAQLDARAHSGADGWASGGPPPIPASRTWNRINDFHVLVWACRGTAQLVVGGRRRRLRQGDVAWLPAGVRNSVTLPRGALLLPLGSRPGPSATLPGEVLVQSFPPQAEDGLLHTAVANYSFVRPEGHDPNGITRRFLELSSAAALPTAADGPSASAVSRIIEELRRAPASPRTLVQWATALAVDARALGHDFLDATGQTYPQWRAQLRMTLARQYLEEGMTVTRAARTLGYADASALSRVFTRAHGMPPSAYRRNGWQHTGEELILR